MWLNLYRFSIQFSDWLLYFPDYQIYFLLPSSNFLSTMFNSFLNSTFLIALEKNYLYIHMYYYKAEKYSSLFSCYNEFTSIIDSPSCCFADAWTTLRKFISLNLFLEAFVLNSFHLFQIFSLCVCVMLLWIFLNEAFF